MAARGMFKGFLEEFTQKAGVIAGIVLAALFTGRLTVALAPLIIRFHLGIWGSLIIAFLLVFIGYIFIRFLLGIMGDLFAVGHMSVVNHFLGLAFGALEGIAIVVVLIYVLRLQTLVPMVDMFAGSVVVEQLWPVLSWMLKIDFKAYLSDFKGVL